MWSDFFAYPFRVFFLNACIFAVMACFGLIFSPQNFIALHQFVFLQNFLGAAFVGFLFTAFPIWCKVEPNLAPLSAVFLALLWGAFLIELCFGLGYILMSVFWFCLFVISAFWLIKSKNKANLSLVFILCGLFVLCFAKIFWQDLRLSYAFIHLCILATLIISLKISLVLGNDVLISLNKTNLSFVPNVIFKNTSCFLLFVFILAMLWGQSANLQGFLALGVGFSLFSRLTSWHYAVFFKTHYTFILYLLFLSLSLAYIGLGLVYFFDLSYLSYATHFLNLFVVLTFVLFVFNTVSLKHTQNQHFSFTFSTKLSFFALFLAALFRSVLALLFISTLTFESFYLTIPALLVLLVFLYFAIHFFPIYKNNAFKGDE